MVDPARSLMLLGVSAVCPDCDAERLLVPAEDETDSAVLAYCCTDCDAAILLASLVILVAPAA